MKVKNFSIINIFYSFNLLTKNINAAMFRRISAISLTYAGVLAFNTLYIQSIGSGIGLYSGLFNGLNSELFCFAFDFAQHGITVDGYYYLAININVDCMISTVQNHFNYLYLSSLIPIFKNNLKNDQNLTKSVKTQNRIIHYILILIYIAGIMYTFYKLFYSSNISGFTIIGFMFSLIVSYIITHFVLNKYQYSKNILIRFIQKLIIYSVSSLMIILLVIYIGYILDIEWIRTVHCDGGDDDPSTSSSNNKTDNNKNLVTVDKTTDSSTNKEYYEFKVEKKTLDHLANQALDTGVNVAKEAAPALFAGSAAGALGAAVFNGTAHLPLPSRVAVAALATGAGAATAVAGGTFAKAAVNGVMNQAALSEMIAKSDHANPDVTRVPSPDNPFINSMIEIGDTHSPLETLLKSLFGFNLLLLILFIAILILIIYNYVLVYNNNFILSLAKKYLSPKGKSIEILNKISIINKDYSRVIILIIILVMCFIMLAVILANILISAELYMNIDDYVNVYNFLKQHNMDTNTALEVLKDNIEK